MISERATPIAGIGTGRRTDALLEAIFGLSDALELDVIAEGIEEASQLHRLRALGSRMGQGFLFARPAPAAEFVLLMASGQLAGPWPDTAAGHRTRPVAGETRMTGASMPSGLRDVAARAMAPPSR